MSDPTIEQTATILRETAAHLADYISVMANEIAAPRIAEAEQNAAAKVLKAKSDAAVEVRQLDGAIAMFNTIVASRTGRAERAEAQVKRVERLLRSGRSFGPDQVVEALNLKAGDIR